MDTRYEVMKFGGSCLFTPEDYLNAAKIISMQKHPVVVVSAAKGITQELLDLSEMTEIKTSLEKIHSIRTTHKVIMAGLGNTGLRNKAQEELRMLFQELVNIVTERKFADQAEKKALILSYGEKLSSVMMKWYLSSLNITANEIFANEIVVSGDENILEATADEKWSRILIQERISQLEQTGSIPVITGFICRTPAGKTAVLGRNSSDYTAALVSSSLKGSSLTFWKDVPGLMTGDPKFVKDCRILRKIGYDEADGFISNGAKILHSKVISLSRENNVPIRIKDFRNPEDIGTLIGNAPEFQIPDILDHPKSQNLFSM